MVDVLHSENEYKIYRSVGLALVSCYCFITVSAVIVLEMNISACRLTNISVCNFRLGGNVSAVYFIVPLKDIKPFLSNLTRAATRPEIEV